MFKVDVKIKGGEVKTLDFSTEADRDSFLNGETTFDAKDYWVSLDNAKVIKVWEDCDCKTVAVVPTPETSWGIADRYSVKCCICDKILVDEGTVEEVRQYVKTNNCVVKYGEKYI